MNKNSKNKKQPEQTPHFSEMKPILKSEIKSHLYYLFLFHTVNTDKKKKNPILTFLPATSLTVWASFSSSARVFLWSSASKSLFLSCSASTCCRRPNTSLCQSDCRPCWYASARDSPRTCVRVYVAWTEGKYCRNLDQNPSYGDCLVLSLENCCQVLNFQRGVSLTCRLLSAPCSSSGPVLSALSAALIFSCTSSSTFRPTCSCFFSRS